MRDSQRSVGAVTFGTNNLRDTLGSILRFLHKRTHSIPAPTEGSKVCFPQLVIVGVTFAVHHVIDLGTSSDSFSTGPAIAMLKLWISLVVSVIMSAGPRILRLCDEFPVQTGALHSGSSNGKTPIEAFFSGSWFGSASFHE
jgi:hypothetical protein